MATKKKSESSGGGAQQFLVWHGEKIVVGIVAVIALWFAVQGLVGYQTLSWQPNALEEDATAADTAIKASTRTAEAEGIELPELDHKTFAAQIREQIKPEIYRNPNEALWHPIMPTSSQRTTGTGGSMDYGGSPP